MSYYAVIDTNVLVSALLTKNPEVATVKILYSVASGDIIPLFSSKILEEYDEVLHRAKFPFSEERVKNLLRMITQYGEVVNPASTGEILIDPDDLVFYEVVMEKRDDNAYLVTGNQKHFPQREYIVTPAEMMEIIENSR